MDANTLKSLIANAQTFLPAQEFSVFRKQINEVYLQSELRSLYNGMPLDKEPEPWRAEKISRINQQLQAL